MNLPPRNNGICLILLGVLLGHGSVLGFVARHQLQPPMAKINRLNLNGPLSLRMRDLTRHIATVRPVTMSITRPNSSSLNSSSALIENEQQRQTFLQKMKNKLPPKHEIKKLLPLGMMFFCILFNYTILRDTKDVLMVTAPKSGAEVIPFIKTYVNLPMAILFTILYGKTTDRFEQKEVFYIFTIPFLFFFAAFAWTIYPNVGWLHPHVAIDALASVLPAGASAPLSLVRNWSFTLFYTLAEMWGSVVVSLLFWGFANEVTTVDEAKKYYPLFGMGANVALIFSGQFVKWVSNMRGSLPPGVDAWGVSLKYLMGGVCASGAVLLATFRFMQDKVLNDPQCVDVEKRKEVAAARSSKKKRARMSTRESFKFLLDSKYIRDLATLVIGYGMCINIVEVSWKAKLKAAFPDPNAYSAFMGNFSSATGVATLTMMLLGRKIFKKFGWGVAAKVTPTMIGVTGLSFFALTLFPGVVAPLAATFGTSPLMLAVLVGAIQNILSKSSKYSLFDPCKEMAYIPLDQESKTKGKAAVDVIGNPMGKSGGALIQQFLIFAVGSLAAATPVSFFQ
uniref:ADP,ATP carrier protein n=1 Tax=Corethron hystrix TaxID=216773 RepID=A0A7S1G0A1_9STRA|mmetsp:Transcript_5533/g.11521  ORF Transcript_5533/g.11521 Transcript_5533/m.11521 type:complete len:564 (+) Transcript_5533:198-1889(+)